MTDEVIRIEYDLTLDEVVTAYARTAQGTKAYRRWRLRSLVLGGAFGGVIGVMFAAGLFGRRVGLEVVVAIVIGGVIGSLFRPAYDRKVTRRMRAMLMEQIGAKMPMRTEVELRPACLWIRQDSVEVTYDWTTVTAVEDRVDGVAFLFDWGFILAPNRAFAAVPDRELFVNRACASVPERRDETTQPATCVPS